MLRTLESALADLNVTRMTAASGSLIGFIAGLTSHDFNLLGAPNTLGPLAPELPTRAVAFRKGRIRIEGDLDAKPRIGAILSIKKYGPSTWPGMFTDLDLPVETVVTQSFTPVGNTAAVEKMRLTMRQMGASDDMAVSLREQLAEAADDVDSGRVIFGEHHMTATVYAENEDVLERAVAEMRRAGQLAGATLIPEGFAARATWFAQMPGNFRYRARSSMISSRNFVDLAALHARPEGRSAEQTPWGSVLTQMPTPEGEIYNLNLHAPGKPGAEPSAGHTVIVGKTGSGKSLLTMFLIAQAMQRGARVFAFDKDRGLEMAIRALGGDYTEIRAGQTPGLNPFAAETGDRGIGWLTDWICALIEADGTTLTGAQANAVADAVRENALHRRQQTIRHFANLFKSLDDGQDLYERLSQWRQSGRYGWVLDHAGEDSFALDGDLIGIDMTELMDLERERMAILSYLFRRIECLVEDGRPTLIVLDEAWKLLDDGYFAKRLKDWMLTMRKKNTALVMLVQQVSHLEDSRAGRAIIENAVTRLILPNAEAKPESYAVLGLNDAECAIATASSAGRRVLLRGPGESVLLNGDLSALGPAMTILGGGGAGKRLVGPDWQDNPDFWRDVCE